MTQSQAYNGIYDVNIDAKAHRVFFAFNRTQLKEGMKECGYEDESEIVSIGAGLCGSENALDSYLDAMEDQKNRVTEQCDPQQIYDYEFDNHECGYTCDDEEAIKIVVTYFGKDRARLVKRKHALISIDDL